AVDEERGRGADTERGQVAHVLLDQLLALALHVGLELVDVEADLLRVAEDDRAALRRFPAALGLAARLRRARVLVELAVLVALVPQQRVELLELGLFVGGACRPRTGGGTLG